MVNGYSSERNVQILVQLMKAHGVKRVVASPGSTNVCFVASVQQDPFFEVISVIDERSAAYVACGLAAQTGEPVALSCTGATASRNYMPGLTEAYYRHLPILAITSTQPRCRVGRGIPQVLDRSTHPNDVVCKSVYLQQVTSGEDEWSCTLMANEALLELKRKTGHPVHVDLETGYSTDFTVKELPSAHKITRYFHSDNLPEPSGKVAVFVGAHERWTDELTEAVDGFCERYNSVVLCDQTSNYQGRYRILANLVCIQAQYGSPCKEMDTLIHIGELSGCYMNLSPAKVWRVHPDGELRDPFKALDQVYEMSELDFFNKMNAKRPSANADTSYSEAWRAEYEEIYHGIPELPLSNVEVARVLSKNVPAGSVVHFGILNSLRAWNLFDMTEGVEGYCNVGGFGIDGNVSSLIGASLADKERLFFGIVGDLAFFYDLNSIGNRHIGGNVRLVLINNGQGAEFRNSISWTSMLGEEAAPYIAAAGHNGACSRDLVRHYAQDLGFDYVCITTKSELEGAAPMIVSPEMREKPLLVEVFTNHIDENTALERVIGVKRDMVGSAKTAIKSLLGERGVRILKKTIHR